MHSRALLCGVLTLFLPNLGDGATQLPKSEPWIAQWITLSSAPQRDECILHFRKVIDLPKQPNHFFIDVSADNQFTLYVNGQRVGSGPSRADLAHWRYETYDIASWFHPGKNVLSATVWNFGTHSAFAQMSDRIAFLVHGHSESERSADTDATWDVEQEKGISTIQPRVRGYFAAEPGERLDGTLFDWSWDRLDAPGSWTKATPLSRAAFREGSDSHNNWQLVSDPLPPMEMRLVSAGKVVRTSGLPASMNFPESPISVPPHARATILIDNSHLTTAYPDLTVSGGPGAAVRLTYSEALYDANGEKDNRDQIEGKHIEGPVDEFLPGGQPDCEFMPLTWRTWRYLQIDIETADQPVTLKNFQTWFTAYPFSEVAHFRSDDPTLDRIWDVGWRTARLDAHDTYMDTPFWERLQYVGDTRIQALISYTVAGDDRLARQAIQAFNDSRMPDGLTQSRYPSSLRQIIPTFSLLWIGMVHDFWQYRGDADFVRAQLPGIRGVLDWFLRRTRSDGLLERPAWWPFVDWGKDFDFGVPAQDPDGGSSVITLQFIEALRYAAELESAYGDPQLADKYRAAATRAAAPILRLCWNEQYGLFADTPAQKHFSQHANILGVWLDVIPPDQQKSVLNKILSTTDPGFTANGTVPPMTAATYYFRFYLARALVHAGMGDEYLHLLGPWKTMLSLGLSTWAESTEPSRSDSHAWSAHPNYDLLTIVAGLRPASPGFKTIRIEPHLGDLKHIDAVMPTPNGLVTAEYNRTPSGIDAEFDLPEAITGELVWQGRTTALNAGRQKVNLPIAVER